MDSWRKQGDNYNQEARTRSNYRKPPLGSWQPTVPSWEKKFCLSVGSVPWRKLLETKRCMHLYDNVVKWNDSAGEEAFRNAKNRFYAYIHGLPCDISLPDPDIYIDEIDWDSKIDPNLIQDLECENVVPDVKDEKVVIFGDSLFSNQGFSTAGWGDSEEDIKKATNSSSENNDNHGAVEGNGWGDFDDNCNNNNSNNNLWASNENNRAKGDSGWGDKWNNSWGWDVYENNTNNVFEDAEGNNGWGWEDVNNGKREGNGRYMSRYKTSRFRGDDNQNGRNHSWRSGNGRKRVNSCAPVSHNASGKAGQRWSLEKPVS